MKTVTDKLVEYIGIADENSLKVISAVSGNEKLRLPLEQVHAMVKPLRIAVTVSHEPQL